MSAPRTPHPAPRTPQKMTWITLLIFMTLHGCGWNRNPNLGVPSTTLYFTALAPVADNGSGYYINITGYQQPSGGTDFDATACATPSGLDDAQPGFSWYKASVSAVIPAGQTYTGGIGIRDWYGVKDFDQIAIDGSWEYVEETGTFSGYVFE